jgi:hypothetical protein
MLAPRRVTRLGEFSANECLFTLGSILHFQKYIVQNFWLVLSTVKVVQIFSEMYWAMFGRYFSQIHLAALRPVF